MNAREMLHIVAEDNRWTLTKTYPQSSSRGRVDIFERDGLLINVEYVRRSMAIKSADLWSGSTLLGNAFFSGKRDQVLEWLRAERKATAPA